MISSEQGRIWRKILHYKNRTVYLVDVYSGVGCTDSTWFQ